MIKKLKDPRGQLRNISSLFIGDLLNTSDTEILTEAAKKTSSKNSGEVAKAAYQNALQITGKRRLQIAREALKNDRENNAQPMARMDIQKARRLLEKFVANDPKFNQKITLAARNLQDISDSEVFGIIRDLQRLGAIPEDE